MRRPPDRGVVFGAVLAATLYAVAFGAPKPGKTVAPDVPPSSKTALAPAPGAVTLKGPGSVSGVWANSDYNRGRVFDSTLQVLLTADGKPPPAQAWAAKLLAERIKAGQAGHPYATPLSQCMPSGVPAMLFYPGLPIQILETPGQVTMLNEEMTYWRLIKLNGRHEQDPDPSFNGDSVAHWDKDGALVIDTIALNTRTTLDQSGLPHSEDLHVVERYRRTDKDTLEVVVRIDDPKTFTAPWTAITHFKLTPKDRRIEEYICENNRNRPDSGGRISTQMPAGR